MSLEDSKLSYFPMPGRAEAIRIALVAAGVKFTDERIPPPSWPALKATTPWGSMPFLSLADGTVLAQSNTILRFIGKKTGTYPEDPLAAARVDEVMDVLADLGTKINAVGRGLEQEAKNAERAKAIAEGPCFDILAKLDAFVAANGSDGHSVGAELTVADFLLFSATCVLVSGFYDGVPPTCLDAHKNIQAVRKMVATTPAIVAFYDGEGRGNGLEAPMVAARDL